MRAQANMAAQAAEERDGDADEGRDGGERVGAMMPGVGLHGGALELLPVAVDGAEEQLLHDHDHDEDDEGERLRRVMRLGDFEAAANPEPDRGGEDA